MAGSGSPFLFIFFNFMLPQEAIKEYKEIYRKRYGVALGDEEASLRANNLIKLYKAVYGKRSISDSNENLVKNNELTSNHN